MAAGRVGVRGPTTLPVLESGCRCTRLVAGIVLIAPPVTPAPLQSGKDAGRFELRFCTDFGIRWPAGGNEQTGLARHSGMEGGSPPS